MFQTFVCSQIRMQSPSAVINRSNQSIFKKINSDHSLEGLMLKLKLQYFGNLLQRAYWWEKTLMLGKIEGKRIRGWQDEMGGWHHRLNGCDFEQSGRWWRTGKLGVPWPWGHKESESDTAELLNNNKYHLGRPVAIEGRSSHRLRHLQKHQAPLTDRNTAKLPCCCIVSFPQDKGPPES